MTAPVDTLTQQYYSEQVKNASLVAQFILARWLLLVNPDNVAGTSKEWFDEAIAAILRGRRQSYLLASAYITAIRRIEIPLARPLAIPQPSEPPRELLETSLRVTGPGELFLRLSKIPDEPTVSPNAPLADLHRAQRAQQQIQELKKEARATAGAMAAASAFKNVQAGGRDTIDTVFTTDKSAEAWIRVTSDHPCGFCLMLASRGPVYRKDSFDRSDPRFNGPGDWKAHDGCGCTGRLAFRLGGDRGWTPLARQAEGLWTTSTRGKSGKNAINAFRGAARAAGIADLTRW